jgi:hypothetical protein
MPEPVDLAVELYPNPARDRLSLYVQVPEAGPLEVAVYDVLGRRVAAVAASPRAAGSVDLTIPVVDLAPGVYFVRVETREATATRSFVRVR